MTPWLQSAIKPHGFQERRVFDILVAGGGISGLSTALALRATFGDALRIGVIDPVFGARDANVRTSALAAGSVNLLDAIGVWPDIADRAGPMRSLKITDSRRNDSIRPLFLQFDEPLDDGAPFSYMVRNADVIDALEKKVLTQRIDILKSAVARLMPSSRYVEIRLADGSVLKTRLLIGADGVNSRVRRSAGIETVAHDYKRSAIVATVAHEEDHHGAAVQHFLPPGPFAMLPLAGRRSSIVWTEYQEDVASYLSLPPEEFLEQVERRFGYSLGAFRLEDGPATFPLRVHLARSFIAPRIALIADAAHLVHPLAGQGLNLGFRDIAALVEALAEQIRLGLDPGEANALKTYQRARFFDTATMVAATHGLHTLFANDIAPLRLIRDLGMGFVDRMPRLKRRLIQDAAGLQGRVPALLLGRLP
jgi:2-octaprenyl-6-methoxyphenol hydroxylase